MWRPCSLCECEQGSTGRMTRASHATRGTSPVPVTKQEAAVRHAHRVPMPSLACREDVDCADTPATSCSRLSLAGDNKNQTRNAAHRSPAAAARSSRHVRMSICSPQDCFKVILASSVASAATSSATFFRKAMQALGVMPVRRTQSATSESCPRRTGVHVSVKKVRNTHRQRNGESESESESERERGSLSVSER